MLMLVVIALICFGSYFSVDEIQNLGPLWTNTASKYYMGIDLTQFSVLYSVYSWPNVVLAFFGGMIGDRFGLRISSFVFSLFVFLGTAVVAVGGSFGNVKGWIIMVVGRVLLGIGGESLNVIQTAMNAAWFEDTSYMAMAFGLVLSASRLGDSLSISLAGPVIQAMGNYVGWLWIGAVICFVSVLAVVAYGFLDKWSEKYHQKKAAPPEKVNWGAVLTFDSRFWVISLLTMIYYAGVTPFLGQASTFLTEKYYPNDTSKSGLVSSIIIYTSMILSPFLGRLVDHFGRRPYFILGGALFILPAHILLAWENPLTKAVPILPIVMIGLSFSLVPAALWPSIPLLIEEENIATAYGAMTSIQNLGLALFNLATGPLLIIGPNIFMLLFVCVDIVGIILAHTLIVMDHKKGAHLCITGEEKRKLLAAENTDYKKFNDEDD
jgi:MFS family permease